MMKGGMRPETGSSRAGGLSPTGAKLPAICTAGSAVRGRPWGRSRTPATNPSSNASSAAAAARWKRLSSFFLPAVRGGEAGAGAEGLGAAMAAACFLGAGSSAGLNAAGGRHSAGAARGANLTELGARVALDPAGRRRCMETEVGGARPCIAAAELPRIAVRVYTARGRRLERASPLVRCPVGRMVWVGRKEAGVYIERGAGDGREEGCG